MIRLLLIFVSLLSVTFWLGSETERPGGPNVLLILTDDQGYGDLNLHGNTFIETPVLNQFAHESAQFERFYVSPLCAPTRASLLTGRYHLRTGTVSVSKGLEVMKSEETTLAELFKANGYKTGIFGKWHNGQHLPNHPNGQGFDEFFGFCGGHWSNYFDTHLEHNGQEVSTKGFITDVLTDRALSFIDKHRNQPFFCYVPLNAPHSPHQVPDRYFDKYKAKGLNDELASVYGMCENIDDNVGRLLKKLEDLKLAKNTIVIFMTDNGPNGNRYNGNMKGIKGSVDEGGIRVPCFVRWKGKIQSSVVKTVSAHIDILPTLQELCRLKPVKTLPLDGISLASELLGKASPSDRKMYTHTAQPELPIKSYPGGIRTDRYRLVVKENVTELYDMLADPGQKQDLSKTQPDITQKLLKEYRQWFLEVSKEIKPKLTIPLSTKRLRIELPTYEATFSGNLKYREGHGWVHDWLIHWTSPQDSIAWNVESALNQRFRIEMLYTCSAENIGSEIEVRAANQRITKRITKAFNPPPVLSPDRVPRKEVYEKAWEKVAIGSVLIPKGKSKIVISASHIEHKEVAEIKSIVLVKQP
jgi:arylsulfatase A-like enzyme